MMRRVSVGYANPPEVAGGIAILFSSNLARKNWGSEEIAENRETLAAKAKAPSD
jgi:hypothetical protein